MSEISIKPIVSIHGDDYRVELSSEKYRKAPAQPVLEIYELDTGMPSGVITVCIPGVSLEKGETIIKSTDGCDYASKLLEADIIKAITRTVVSGYANFPVVSISEKFLEQAD